MAVDNIARGMAAKALENQGGGGSSLPIVNTATVGQTIRVFAVDENGQPTEWEAVDITSGGKAKTQKLIDVTFEEAAASLSVTLEHNFHKLFLVWSCGKDGVARTVDTDGSAVSGNLGVILDSTSFGWNDRKIGQISGNTLPWKIDGLLIEYTDDLSTLLPPRSIDIGVSVDSKVACNFGGSLAMLGTLGDKALAPTVGKTVNIVLNNGLFAATTRIIMVGEYYE